MNAKLRLKAKKRKQRLQRGIDTRNHDGSSPVIKPPKIQYELADKQ